MGKLKGQNIFTELIADELDITMDVALRVHEEIDNWYDLDWSEASHDEIVFTAWLAFENLNEVISV